MVDLMLSDGGVLMACVIAKGANTTIGSGRVEGWGRMPKVG